MSRVIKRVPDDFQWPLYQRWSGYLRPDQFDEYPCEPCEGRGYSPAALLLFDVWYGNARFDPAATGSTPFTARHPIIRARAEWNVNEAPDYYGRELVGVRVAVLAEAQRLASHFNRAWMHHLAQQDVDALLADDRLWDFTRIFTRGRGWQQCLGGTAPTAAEVNEWSLSGLGHDSCNASTVVRARCAAAGVSHLCQLCDGDGSFQVYAGQREEAEAWEYTEPPAGAGWQAWETISKGSPISPVFGTAEELATWWSNPDRTDRYAKDWMPYPAAHQFILAGSSAGTAVALPDGQVVAGHEYVGMADQATIAGA
jgi:hypothetical protein